MEEKELTNDLADWSKKAQASKGGTVVHHVRTENIKKDCGCNMGDKCCKHKSRYS